MYAINKAIILLAFLHYTSLYLHVSYENGEI